jgi:hypothetical protein
VAPSGPGVPPVVEPPPLSGVFSEDEKQALAKRTERAGTAHRNVARVASVIM